jgi:hypothetical protein
MLKKRKKKRKTFEMGRDAGSSDPEVIRSDRIDSPS